MVACVLVLVLMAVWCRKHPVVPIATSFIFVAFFSRLIAAAYVGGVDGEVEAEEMSAPIASEWASETFAAAMLISMSAFFLMLRPTTLQVRAVGKMTRSKHSLANGFFLATALFILVLYMDMLRIGIVPLLEGMERFVYANEHAGVFHHVLFEHGVFICFWLSAMLLFPALSGGRPDMRFAVLFVFILAYAFLTGHRFSAFFSFSTYFLMPFAGLVLTGKLKRTRATEGTRREVLARLKVLWFAVAIIVALLVLAALVNSFVNVRGYDESEGKLVQRLFVQPIQLWWATWTRVTADDWNPALALGYMFVAPLEPGRNTGIQYLMLLELGIERTADLLAQGQQYTGGFPEILFEVFGPVGGWVVTALTAAITAWLTRIWLKAFVEGRFVTAFAGLYVFFALSLLLLGGMLNFLAAWTFWAKVTVLIVANVVESRRLNSSRPPIAQPNGGGRVIRPNSATSLS
jgi:hypothetical protein